jgi:hypothetical protein
VTGPFWLAGILAVIMISTAAYCATRLIIARVHRRPDERDVDLVHAVMGVAMAGMLVSWLNPLPDGVWAVMFGAATAWFGWRAWHDRRSRAERDAAARPAGRPPHPHHVPHLVMCGAMVYMLLAAGAVTSATHPDLAMGGPSAGGRFPLLALLLAIFMVGYVMWQADRLPALARTTGEWGRAQPGGPPVAPAIAAVGGQATQAGETATAPAPPVRPAPAPKVLSPRLAACCQIAMAVTMGYMLILML